MQSLNKLKQDRHIRFSSGARLYLSQARVAGYAAFSGLAESPGVSSHGPPLGQELLHNYMDKTMVKLAQSLLWLAICVPVFAQAAPVDPWTIDSGPIDPEHYYGETISNGMIGMRTMAVPFRTEQTLMSGAYDPLLPGYAASTLVSGFDFLNLGFSIDGKSIENLDQVANFRQRLRMKDAAFVTTFEIKDRASVTCTLRALEHLPYTALLEVSVVARHPVVIRASARLDSPQASVRHPGDEPLALKDVQKYEQPVEVTKSGIRLQAASARTELGRQTIAAANGFIFDEAPADAPTVELLLTGGLTFSKCLAAGETYHFAVVGTTMTSAHVSHPTEEALRLTSFAIVQGTRDLVARHEAAWSKLWESDIRIEGNDEDQRDVHSMLYHLYAAARADATNSIAPMGLSRSVHGYLGHIFVDAEDLLPTLAVLHPELAEPILGYRFRRLDAAKRNATAHGYEGAMFPWESAASGEEESPTVSLSGTMEQVAATARVGIASWTYYQATQDSEWLRNKGYPLMRATADFIASRVTRNGPGHFDILHVIGGDECVPNVDNSAGVNGHAIACLADATAAAKVLGLESNPDWELVRRNIPIPRFADGVIKQYATYNGQPVPHGDFAALVDLKLISDSAQIRQNLDYYEPRSHAIFCPTISIPLRAIAQYRAGETEKAYRLFKDSYKSVIFPPFGVIAEYENQRNPYYVTGAGLVPQVVLFGFGGLDITDKGIVQQPARLPAAWTSLTLTGIGPDRKTIVIK